MGRSNDSLIDFQGLQRRAAPVEALNVCLSLDDHAPPQLNIRKRAVQRSPELRWMARIRIKRSIAGYLRQGCFSGADHRDCTGHCLEDREAESLI